MYRTLRNRILEPAIGSVSVGHEDDADERADAVEVGRLNPCSEGRDELAVDEELAAQDAADARPGRTAERLHASRAFAAERVVGPRVELEVRGKLRVVDRPLRQLPAEHGGAVRPGRDLGLVRAERPRAGVQAGQLAGGDVDDAAPRGQMQRLARAEEV